MTTGRAAIAEMDKTLQEVDDAAVTEGKPILSPIVRHDDGSAGNAFWRSVIKHKLRLLGESDDALLERLTKLAHDYYARAALPN